MEILWVGIFCMAGFAILGWGIDKRYFELQNELKEMRKILDNAILTEDGE